MPSLLSILDFLCRRFWRITLTLSLAFWLAACQKSPAPEVTSAGPPPPPSPAGQPAPQPAPQPVEAAKGDPAPTLSPAPTPPIPSPPQAGEEPPTYQYQRQQQQQQQKQRQQQASIDRPLPPVYSGQAPSANGGLSAPRPPPKYSARPPSAAPRPTPEAAPARPSPPAAANGGAETAASASPPPPAIAQFDWPPPKASAQEAIPDKWLRTGPAPTLADVADKFEKAMKLAGYQQRSYYSVPRGFALAAQFEHIRADGTPLPGDDRWKVGPPRVGNLSLLAFIQALAHAPAGLYRAIVFVVTDAPWAQSATAPSEAQIMAWAGSGAAALPAAIGDLPYGPNYRAHALIYEFRKGSSGPAETVLPSAVSGEIHLDKGGLWNPLSIL